jgi:hypothetical protein
MKIYQSILKGIGANIAENIVNYSNSSSHNTKKIIRQSHHKEDSNIGT